MPVKIYFYFLVRSYVNWNISSNKTNVALLTDRNLICCNWQDFIINEFSYSKTRFVLTLISYCCLSIFLSWPNSCSGKNNWHQFVKIFDSFLLMTIAKRNIPIFDDNKNILSVLEIFLTTEFWTVTTLSDPNQVATKCKRKGTISYGKS